MARVRSKHSNLLNYFIHDRRDLSSAYVRKCEEFIDSLGSSKLADCFKMEKPQATSAKPQASSKESTWLPQNPMIEINYVSFS